MSTIVIERSTATDPIPTRVGRLAAATVLVTGAALQVVEFALENPPDDNAIRVAH